MEFSVHPQNNPLPEAGKAEFEIGDRVAYSHMLDRPMTVIEILGDRLRLQRQDGHFIYGDAELLTKLEKPHDDSTADSESHKIAATDDRLPVEQNGSIAAKPETNPGQDDQTELDNPNSAGVFQKSVGSITEEERLGVAMGDRSQLSLF